MKTLMSAGFVQKIVVLDRVSGSAVTASAGLAFLGGGFALQRLPVRHRTDDSFACEFFGVGITRHASTPFSSYLDHGSAKQARG